MYRLRSDGTSDESRSREKSVAGGSSSSSEESRPKTVASQSFSQSFSWNRFKESRRILRERFDGTPPVEISRDASVDRPFGFPVSESSNSKKSFFESHREPIFGSKFERAQQESIAVRRTLA